jgi:hypothetical protein
MVAGMLLTNRYGWATDMIKAAINIIEPISRTKSTPQVRTAELKMGITRPKSAARKYVR